MRIGTPWRLAVLASVAILTSGQLCMLTTCVPRLTRSHAGTSQAETAHACCSGAPVSNTPAPMPSGAMPCAQLVSLTDAPTLDAPSPNLAAVAVVAAGELSLAPIEPVLTALLERDAGPAPGVHRPAPPGLRAPPCA